MLISNKRPRFLGKQTKLRFVINVLGSGLTEWEIAKANAIRMRVIVLILLVLLQFLHILL